MSDKSKGVISIIASAFGFAVMAACVRLCDDYGAKVSCFEKSFFRNAVAVLIAVVAFVRTSRHSEIALPHGTGWWLLILRSAVGTLGIIANFYALSHIDIAEGQTLNKTAPFFTIFFAWLFLNERITRWQMAALAMAFVGMLLIAKPGFAVADEALPLLSGLLGGACAGGAYACLRALRSHGVSPTFIVLFFSIFSSLSLMPFIIASFDPLTWQQVLILIGAGVGAALGQFGVTLAYGYAAPREIAVFDYTNVLFTSIFGFLLFDQLPDAFSFVGFIIILAAAWSHARSLT